MGIYFFTACVDDIKRELGRGLTALNSYIQYKIRNYTIL